jgi:hypothetical protein
MPKNGNKKDASSITDLIEFPVFYNFHYGTIYDSRNREIATVKTLASSDETRLRIGDWIANAMNETNQK